MPLAARLLLFMAALALLASGATFSHDDVLAPHSHAVASAKAPSAPSRIADKVAEENGAPHCGAHIDSLTACGTPMPAAARRLAGPQSAARLAHRTWAPEPPPPQPIRTLHS